MALGNPHFVDDETGAVMVLDDSGWAKLEKRFCGADIYELTMREVRVIFDLIVSARAECDDDCEGDCDWKDMLLSILGKVDLEKIDESERNSERA